MSPADRSAALAEKAVTALRALIEGLGQALERSSGPSLPELVALDPEAASAGLAVAILRIVVLLHAEARGMAGGPGARPVKALFEGLQGKRDGDGAWAELSAIFRAMVGRAPAEVRLSGRSGAPLFDPDAFAFLHAPLSDRAVARVLSSLLLLDGEELAYETLPLEGLGGVYEALLGVGPRVTGGASVMLGPDRRLLDLEALLALPPERRSAHLAEAAGVRLVARASAGLSRAESVAELVRALRKRLSPSSAALIPKGAVALAAAGARRRSGSHYTPPELSGPLVQATLGPLLSGRRDPDAILALRVCDPAMGGGALLLSACGFLGERLLEARGELEGAGSGARAAAEREIVARCLHGVDKDPIAVDLCRASLWLRTLGPGSPWGLSADKLLCGDSLIGASVADLQTFPIKAFRRGSGAEPESSDGDGSGAAREPGSLEALRRRLDAWTALWFWSTGAEQAAAPTPQTFAGYLDRASGSEREPDRGQETAVAIAARMRFLHWEAAFPAIFSSGRTGFDAILGNPPWVAYAGRAAQPLEPSTFHFYLHRSPAFFGYRTLHGLFVHRAASLLRPGGRLGLILPTSVSDLRGYAPVRAAHDSLCAPDPELFDFGADAFAGVFQPAMGLVSTRRQEPVSGDLPPWRLVRRELTLHEEQLLDRLSALPPLPGAIFGERGYQTMSEDKRRIRELEHPEPPFTIPLREGRDIGPFRRRPPRLHLDPSGIEARMRTPEEWKVVKLLIRQTARYPIAALGDGQPFRNSVLAGFESEEYSAFFLLAYLNSSLIRWFHYTRYRDARQGMPQVKIAHLRGLPAPPEGGDGAEGAGFKARVESIGRAAGERNQGIHEDESEALDALLSAAFGLSDSEEALVRSFARTTPLPRSIFR